MKSLAVKPIRTSIFRKGMELDEFIIEHSKNLMRDGLILAVTSKIVSLAENCVVERTAFTKKDIVLKEADEYLCEGLHGVHLTVKHGLVIPSAGIDESNAEDGGYILYPKAPYESAQRLYRSLKEKLGLNYFGIIITDSHTHALRRGVTGIGLSHWGFEATSSLVGTEDLFGRKLKMTTVNILDSLAVAAVLVMGEASEQQPLAVIDAQGVEFNERTNPQSIQIPLDEDLYGPLLKAVKAKK